MPKQWDDTRKRVKNHELANKINLKLQKWMIKAENYYIDRQLKDEPCTALDIKNCLLGAHHTDFIQYAHDFVEKNSRAQATLRQRRVLVAYLRAYSPALSTAQVNFEFVDKFEAFMVAQRNQKTGRRLSTNYIASMLAVLRTITKQAYRAGVISVDPFFGFRIKRTKKKKSTLTVPEIESLRFLDVSDRGGRIVIGRDAFCFASYTGLRYSDLFTGRNPEQGLRVKHIVLSDKGMRLQKWLFKKREESPTFIDIPLDLLFDGRPREIIRPYLVGKSPEAPVFGPLDNGSYNLHVAYMLKKAGIDKDITAHQARDSFATNVDLPIEMIRQLLGHSSVTTTEIYKPRIDLDLIDQALAAKRYKS